MEQIKPLKGIKVIELSLMVAAASCCRMMASWGADIIKVEDTNGGDTMRKWAEGFGAPTEDKCNPIFDSLNADKQSISINLKTPEGITIMYKLLEDADAFVTNIREKGLKHLGLDYGTLKKKFPKLVMTQLSGYGENGPEKTRPGYDNSAFWARSGFMYSQAVESGDSYPVYMPTGFGDMVCSLGLMAGTVSAILAAQKTGKGDRIFLSLYGTAMWMASILIESSQFGMHFPRSREICSPFGSPFRCSDGRWFMPQIVNFKRDSRKYFHILGADDMIGNPTFAKRENFNRKEVCEQVIIRFEEIFAAKTSSEWYELFTQNDLCCEILCTYEDTLTDKQALSNDSIYTVCYENGLEAKLVNPCIRSQNLGSPEFKAGPMYGEHTILILKENGFSEDEIDNLLESHIVRQYGI